MQFRRQESRPSALVILWSFDGVNFDMVPETAFTVLSTPAVAIGESTGFNVGDVNETFSGTIDLTLTHGNIVLVGVAYDGTLGDSGSGSRQGLGFSNFSVQAIPEPGSMALLAFAMSSLAVFRRLHG